jgi:hypothetical protein
MRSKTDGFLVSITTLDMNPQSRWRSKIDEVRELKVPEIAVFLTGLKSLDERQECFSRLSEIQKSQPLRVPFIHAITAMTEDEFQEWSNAFGTEYFNLHPESEYPLIHPYSNMLRQRLLIENNSSVKSLTQADLTGFAGVCLDLSHFEEMRRIAPEEFEKLSALLFRVPIFANHMSAIDRSPRVGEMGRPEYANHLLTADGGMRYLDSFPRRLWGTWRALELENSITEQLDVLGELRGETLYGTPLRSAA